MHFRLSTYRIALSQTFFKTDINFAYIILKIIFRIHVIYRSKIRFTVVNDGIVCMTFGAYQLRRFKLLILTRFTRQFKIFKKI